MIGIRTEEFEGFIRQYERLVITICLSFTKNYFDAEDLAQETFLSAYRSLDRFDGRNPRAWLAAIAANKCRDYLKSPARRVTSLCPEELACIEDERDSPENGAVEKDTAERVLGLCGKLKEPYRTVATAYFCGGVTDPFFRARRQDGACVLFAQGGGCGLHRAHGSFLRRPPKHGRRMRP